MKETTVNNYQERVNRVLVHIDANLDQPMSLTMLAEVTSFSPFHFHRIFAAHMGETLHGHVRRLRLERAAQRLFRTDSGITEIALAAGFETPAAFTKAFREHFGQTPSAFRGNGGPWEPGTDLTVHRETAAVPQPQLTRVNGRDVLFVRKTGPYEEAAAAAWQALMAFAYARRLMTRETQLIGISHDDPNITPENRIRYDACITFPGSVKPENEVGIKRIAGGRYAVFLHRGAYERMGATINAIFAGWLPGTDRQLREAPCFEMYLNRDPRRTKPENLRTEVWVPVE